MQNRSPARFPVLPNFAAFPPVPHAGHPSNSAGAAAEADAGNHRQSRNPQLSSITRNPYQILVWYFRKLRDPQAVLSHYHRTSNAHPSFRKHSCLVNGHLLAGMSQVQAAAARAALAQQLRHKFVTRKLGDEVLYHLGGSGGTGPSIKKAQFSASGPVRMEDDTAEPEEEKRHGDGQKRDPALAVVLFVQTKDDDEESLSENSAADRKVAEEFIAGVDGEYLDVSAQDPGMPLPDGDPKLIQRVYKLSDAEIDLCRRYARRALQQGGAEKKENAPEPKRPKLADADGRETDDPMFQRAFMSAIADSASSSIATHGLKPMK